MEKRRKIVNNSMIQVFVAYIVADLKVLADNNTNFSPSTVNSLGYPLETLVTYDMTSLGRFSHDTRYRSVVVLATNTVSPSELAKNW